MHARRHGVQREGAAVDHRAARVGVVAAPLPVRLSVPSRLFTRVTLPPGVPLSTIWLLMVAVLLLVVDEQLAAGPLDAPAVNWPLFDVQVVAVGHQQAAGGDGQGVAGRVRETVFHALSELIVRVVTPPMLTPAWLTLSVGPGQVELDVRVAEETAGRAQGAHALNRVVGGEVAGVDRWPSRRGCRLCSGTRAEPLTLLRKMWRLQGFRATSAGGIVGDLAQVIRGGEVHHALPRVADQVVDRQVGHADLGGVGVDRVLALGQGQRGNVLGVGLRRWRCSW